LNKNIAKLVDANTSEGFLVLIILIIIYLVTVSLFLKKKQVVKVI